MAEPFPYDVFLSHSSKDNEIVRPLAERLRADGIKVWYDEWEIQPGDSIPAKIERGLDQSRVLVLCMSKNAFGSDWAQLESGTFRFRDPLNTDRRFIPLKLDDAVPPGSLGQFSHIDWRSPDQRRSMHRVVDALGPRTDNPTSGLPLLEEHAEKLDLILHTDAITSVAFRADGKFAITGSCDRSARVWKVDNARCIAVLEGHSSSVNSVAISEDGTTAITGSTDSTVRVWDAWGGRCTHILKGHAGCVRSVALSSDGSFAISGSVDKTARVWDLRSGRCIHILEGHHGYVRSVTLSNNGLFAASGSADKTIRVWEIASGRCTQVLKGHSKSVWSVALSGRGDRVISGSLDNSVRVWDAWTGRCIRVLDGHDSYVNCVEMSKDGANALSASDDGTIRVWEVVSGTCVRILRGHNSGVRCVSMSTNGVHAITSSADQTVRAWNVATGECVRIFEGHRSNISCFSLNNDGSQVLSGAHDKTTRLWDVASGRCLRVLEGHTHEVNSVALSSDGRRAISGSTDMTVRLWDLESGLCVRIFEGHANGVSSVAINSATSVALSGAIDGSLRLWDVASGRCLRILEGHDSEVTSIAMSDDGVHAVSGSIDDTSLRVWNLANGQCLHHLTGHSGGITSVSINGAGTLALSGSTDRTIRVWNSINGRCVRVLEGHTGRVGGLALSSDGIHSLSCASDNTTRIWDIETGQSLGVITEHSEDANFVAISDNKLCWATSNAKGVLRMWQAPRVAASKSTGDSKQYTNAKVLLVGDTSSGKTALSHRLAHDSWKASEDSTVGAWSTQLPLEDTTRADGVEREIWLWDFGGQADQRLIHQLFMDRAAAVLLLFNADNENVLPGLRDWQAALKRSVPGRVLQFLVAGRTDAGFKASRSKLQTFAIEHGMRFHETSAKEGRGCDQLRQELIDQIPWDQIEERTSPRIFKLIRDELIRLRDEGQVLFTLKELREVLRQRLAEIEEFGESREVRGNTLTPSPGGRGESGGAGEKDRNWFDDATLRTVIGLLDGPGVIKELDYGHYVLLAPEWINAYAQAVIRTLRSADDELGALPIRSIAEGKLIYQSTGRDGRQVDMKRLGPTEERVVLGEMERVLEDRGLCLRQGDKLVFPSHCGRDRPAVVEHPSVFVSYSVKGFLDDVYATLVVKLADMDAFDLDQLWRDAADFVTLDGEGHMGVKLSRDSASDGTISVYFGPGVTEDQQVIFAQYIDSHLRKTCEVSQRLREYVCPMCNAPKGNAKVLMRRLLERKKQADTVCDICDFRFPLWDSLEQMFASDDVRLQVHQLEAEDKVRLSTRRIDKKLILEVGARITSANQKWFEIPQDEDEGIDIEVEFCDDNGNGLGKKLGLQLKSGNSHLRPARKSDGVEVFPIKDQRWVDYWLKQPHPVMLVIGTFPEEDDRFGESQKKRFENVRWMEITSELRRLSENGAKPVKQIDFRGERLDLESVMKWRKKVLSGEVS